MKVIINGLLLKNRYTGVHFSILETLLALQHHPTREFEFEVLIGNKPDPELISGPGFNYKTLNLDSANRFKRIFWEQLLLPSILKRSYSNSIFHSPAYILTRKCPVPSVLTVHDLIALKFPELCQTETELYFRRMLAGSIARANMVVAVSQKVKDDISHELGIEPGKIQVINHGVAQAFKPIPIDLAIRTKYRLPEQYILFVGVLEPKKNIPGLLKAFSQLIRDKELKHDLIIVGRRGWKYTSIFRTVTDLGLEKKVRFLGFVPKADLPALYSMADLFVLPSLDEGFGLPVLEAMACGCPVITSNRGALPEIGGIASLQSDPTDIPHIAENMKTLLTKADVRHQCIQNGFEQAKKFSWKKTADAYLTVYKTLGEKIN